MCTCDDGFERINNQTGLFICEGKFSFSCLNLFKIFLADVDECLIDDTRCGPNSICFNTYGSFTCSCKFGYIMQYRNGKCEDIDECSTSCSNNCDYLNGVCNNELGFYTCTCRNGYTGSGVDKDCNDVNECLYDYIKCQDNSYCVNTIGSYECDCMKGFYNNGTFCEGYKIFC